MVGDASLHASGVSIDASDSLLLVPFDVGAKGWAARKWLDSASLSRLTGLGVGSLHWSVGEQHYQAALAHARELADRGVTRITVVEDPAQLPDVILTASPAAAESTSLHDVMAALGIGSANSMEMLERLWAKTAEGKPGLPRLRKWQAASFLILSSAPEGRIDFKHTRLESVWLDGHQ